MTRPPAGALVLLSVILTGGLAHAGDGTSPLAPPPPQIDGDGRGVPRPGQHEPDTKDSEPAIDHRRGNENATWG